MNVPLLKRLRTRFLRMRHKKHFDMNVWGEKNECGTTACIAGHTLLLEGYTMRYNEAEAEFHFISPKGRKVQPDAAARRLLGLPREITHGDYPDDDGLFFDVDHIKTPKQAAKRIEKILAGAGDSNGQS